MPGAPPGLPADWLRVRGPQAPSPGPVCLQIGSRTQGSRLTHGSIRALPRAVKVRVGSQMKTLACRPELGSSGARAVARGAPWFPSVGSLHGRGPTSCCFPTRVDRGSHWAPATPSTPSPLCPQTAGGGTERPHLQPHGAPPDRWPPARGAVPESPHRHGRGHQGGSRQQGFLAFCAQTRRVFLNLNHNVTRGVPDCPFAPRRLGHACQSRNTDLDGARPAPPSLWSLRSPSRHQAYAVPLRPLPRAREMGG